MFNSILNLKIEVSVTTVAWYGAIVATLSALLAVLNYLRDKTKITVKISQCIPFHGSCLGGPQIGIKAINVGRRQVTLKRAGLKLSNGKIIQYRSSAIGETDFPCDLQEGKSLEVYMEQNEVFEHERNENSKIIYAFYEAATGKTYKTKFRLKK